MPRNLQPKKGTRYRLVFVFFFCITKSVCGSFLLFFFFFIASCTHRFLLLSICICTVSIIKIDRLLFSLVFVLLYSNLLNDTDTRSEFKTEYHRNSDWRFWDEKMCACALLFLSASFVDSTLYGPLQRNPNQLIGHCDLCVHQLHNYRRVYWKTWNRKHFISLDMLTVNGNE